MSELQPYFELRVAIDRTLYGGVVSCPPPITWDFAGLVGSPNTTASGLALDPTGQYIIQQPVIIPVDAGPELWQLDSGDDLPTTLPADGSASTYSAYYQLGTHETQGKGLLRQVRGGAAVTFAAVLANSGTTDGWHADDEGFSLFITRGGPGVTPSGAVATPENFKFYVELSNGRDTGLPGLRLAVEAGVPIRLEASFDEDASWQPVDVATALGDSETYLSGKGRRLGLDIVPLTSSAYWQWRAWKDASDAQGRFPQAAPGSFGDLPPLPGEVPAGRPPDFVAVVIGGGDAVLVWQQEIALFPAGDIRISGQGGQFGVRVARRRYLPECLASLPEQQRINPLSGLPTGRCSGLFPFAGGDGSNKDEMYALMGTVTSRNAARADLTLTTPNRGVDTGVETLAVLPGGGAILTAVLASATLDFPNIFRGPGAVPNVVRYTQADGLYRMSETSRFLPSVLGVTSSASVTFADSQGLLAPGRGVVPAVRAAVLYRGIAAQGQYGAADYDDGCLGVQGFSGLSPNGDEPGFEWFYNGNGVRCFTLHMIDGARENVPLLWMDPWDGRCQYDIAREIGYKLNLPDEYMDFPLCHQGEDCPHYHLPTGTLRSPLFAVPPEMKCMDALRLLRSVSGARDPLTGVVLPMYLYFDRQKHLQFYGMPAGLVNIFRDPAYDPVLAGLSQSKVFSKIPALNDDGTPALNEFQRGGLGSQASMNNIRTSVVLAGQQPTDSAFLFGFSNSPEFGAGDLGDPSQTGYVGVNDSYVDINRLLSSPEAMEISLANTLAQTSFPQISSRFRAHFQSNLWALDTVGVLDDYTQGAGQPVPYYVTGLDSEMELVNKQWQQGSTINAHLLGQATE